QVKLFDADAGRFLDDQTVIADKGRVAALGASATVKPPANARTIDGTGKTLVPGLWDAHMHVADDTTGPMLLSIGVTSVRDPGNMVEPSLSRAARIAKGELLSPAVFPSVLIDGKRPLAAQGGISVGSAEEAVGVKFYGSMKPEWLIPAIAEAKKS